MSVFNRAGICYGMIGVLAMLASGCKPAAPAGNELKSVQPTSAVVRELRRTYSGAPPVIPHAVQSVTCVKCHNETGQVMPGMGIASANPHLGSSQYGSMQRCEQCHVPQRTKELFADTEFVALRRQGKKGMRLQPLAPPQMPHPLYMRENCKACHCGPAARPEIRCTHPERIRCQQCHTPDVRQQGLEFISHLKLPLD